MNIQPLHDRILVQRLDAETKTQGGIIIPETAKEKPMEGKVMAVGTDLMNGEDDKAPTLKVGDRILFGKYAGTEITVEGIEQLILKEEDVLCVVQL